MPSMYQEHHLLERSIRSEAFEKQNSSRMPLENEIKRR